MLKKLGYKKNDILEFNFKRNCGLWFMIIGFVIIASTLFGGDLMINPFIFAIGYGVGFYISNINKAVMSKLSMGKSSEFQDRIGTVGVISLFILMFITAGPFFPSLDWRMIWLGTFLATGLHFFIFYYVHGKSMIYIGLLCTVSAAIGMIFSEIPFAIFGYADGVIKVSFGVYLLFFSKPTTNR